MTATVSERKWFAAVAGLESCVLCGRHGVQVAHRNEGRGMGQKSPSHMTAALCPADHYEIDNGKNLSKDERRALMDRAIVLTHSKLIESGKLRLCK